MERPIAKHHPTTHICSPNLRVIKEALVPNLIHSQVVTSKDDFEEWSLETYEWLSLVGCDSARVGQGDSTDPFLSRYQVPDGESQNSLNIVTMTWTGLIPGEWIRALWISLW